MARQDLGPCRLVKGEDGTYSVSFDDFGVTEDLFAAMGQEGGGYGWHGVVEALVRMKAPQLRRRLDYDPEASTFVALSKDPEALKKVAELIRLARRDSKLLRAAIKNADPDLMD